MILAGNALRELVRTHVDNAVMEKVEHIGDVRIPSYGLEGSGYTVRMSPAVRKVSHGNRMNGLRLATNVPGFVRDCDWANDTNDWPYFCVGDSVASSADELADLYVPIQGRSTSFGDHIQWFLIPPRTFFICDTIEYFRVPTDCIGRLVPKSTIERLGLTQPTMTLEPGWEGTITIECFNATTEAIILYSGVGFAQVHFEALSESVVGYNGRYKGQRGPTTAKI